MYGTSPGNGAQVYGTSPVNNAYSSGIQGSVGGAQVYGDPANNAQVYGSPVNNEQVYGSPVNNEQVYGSEEATIVFGSSPADQTLGIYDF